MTNTFDMCACLPASTLTSAHTATHPADRVAHILRRTRVQTQTEFHLLSGDSCRVDARHLTITLERLNPTNPH